MFHEIQWRCFEKKNYIFQTNCFIYFLNNKCETQSLCDTKIIELAKLAQVVADLPIRSAHTER